MAIREAIQEVSLWAQEASFNLTEHNENGRTTPLIKDWKDMNNEVSDLQERFLIREGPHEGRPTVARVGRLTV